MILWYMIHIRIELKNLLKYQWFQFFFKWSRILWNLHTYHKGKCLVKKVLYVRKISKKSHCTPTSSPPPSQRILWSVNCSLICIDYPCNKYFKFTHSYIILFEIYHYHIWILKRTTGISEIRINDMKITFISMYIK